MCLVKFPFSACVKPDYACAAVLQCQRRHIEHQATVPAVECTAAQDLAQTHGDFVGVE